MTQPFERPLDTARTMNNFGLIVFVLAAASTSAFTAHSKRYSWPLWLVLGAFFPLIAFLVVLLLPTRGEKPAI